jgi:ABC-type multidrug transport system fused ATPase/permease subunit
MHHGVDYLCWWVNVAVSSCLRANLALFGVCGGKFLGGVRLPGPYVLAGLGVMLLVGPITSRFSKKLILTQYAKMKLSDDRTKLFKEIIAGIRVVKSYGWEESFMKAVHAVRSKEAHELMLNQYYMAIILPISLTVPAAAVCITFVIRVVVEGVPWSWRALPTAVCCHPFSARVTVLQEIYRRQVTVFWRSGFSPLSSCRLPSSPWASPT